MEKMIASLTDSVRAFANLLLTKSGALNGYKKENGAVAALEKKEKDEADKTLAAEKLQLQKDALSQRENARLQEAESKAQSAAKAEEEKTRRWNYQLRKDWLADFYKRNEIYMKTGIEPPKNFNKILQDFNLPTHSAKSEE